MIEIIPNDMESTNQELKKVKQAAAEKTSIYSTPLFLLTNNIKKTEVGTGTFAIINSEAGILTNAHVADHFMQKTRGHVSILSTFPLNPINLNIFPTIELQFSKIIFLPKKIMNDIDIAFIKLTDESYNEVKQIEKQFWNIDDSVREWIKNKWHSTEEFVLWGIYGAVAEGRKEKRRPSEPIHIDYKNAGFYIVVPDLKNIKNDRISCPIDTKDPTPKSFEGMSGGALWQVIVNEKLEICQILLRGIATKYKPGAKKALSITCHGPSMIYEVFYPFCVDCLQQDKVDPHLLKHLLAITQESGKS